MRSNAGLYFLLLFGDLLFMRRWYSSCACLDKLGGASAIDASIMAFDLNKFCMPMSPVTVFIVTKGSSNRSLSRAIKNTMSISYLSVFERLEIKI